MQSWSGPRAGPSATGCLHTTARERESITIVAARQAIAVAAIGFSCFRVSEIRVAKLAGVLGA